MGQILTSGFMNCLKISKLLIYKYIRNHKNSLMVASHDGTEPFEHIQIITTSAQEADNLIPNSDRLLSTIWAGVIKTARNIGMYCSRVSRVRYGHK